MPKKSKAQMGQNLFDVRPTPIAVIAVIIPIPSLLPSEPTTVAMAPTSSEAAVTVLGSEWDAGGC